MIFYLFIMACKKYEFRYMVTSYIKPSLILYPSNTFDKIGIIFFIQSPISDYKMASFLTSKLASFMKNIEQNEKN